MYIDCWGILKPAAACAPSIGRMDGKKRGLRVADYFCTRDRLAKAGDDKSCTVPEDSIYRTCPYCRHFSRGNQQINGGVVPAGYFWTKLGSVLLKGSTDDAGCAPLHHLPAPQSHAEGAWTTCMSTTFFPLHMKTGLTRA